MTKIGQSVAFASLVAAATWLELNGKPSSGLWVIVGFWVFLGRWG